jgi:hypothetical protein
VWHHGPDGQGPLSPLWDSAREIDPALEGEASRAGTTRGHLAELFAEAAIRTVEVGTVAVDVAFGGFAEWWEPFLLGVGSVGACQPSAARSCPGCVRRGCRLLRSPFPRPHGRCGVWPADLLVVIAGARGRRRRGAGDRHGDLRHARREQRRVEMRFGHSGCAWRSCRMSPSSPKCSPKLEAVAMKAITPRIDRSVASACKRASGHVPATERCRDPLWLGYELARIEPGAQQIHRRQHAAVVELTLRAHRSE